MVELADIPDLGLGLIKHVKILICRWGGIGRHVRPRIGAFTCGSSSLPAHIFCSGRTFLLFLGLDTLNNMNFLIFINLLTKHNFIFSCVDKNSLCVDIIKS